MSNEDQNEDDRRDEGEDAEGSDAEGQDEEGDQGFLASKKKLLIIVGAVLLLLAGAGAGLYFTGMLDSLLGKQESHQTEGEAGDAAHTKKASKKKKSSGHGGGEGGEAVDGAAFLEIPPMIVNLNTEDGTPRYLRLSVQLELEDQEDLHAVEAIMPRVVDQFQTYLRELRVQDLRGSSGIYRLQMELLWRVNQAAAPVEVKDVLFQEFLIQ